MQAYKTKFINLPDQISGDISIDSTSVADAIVIHSDFILKGTGTQPKLGGNLTITASGTPVSGQNIFLLWMTGIDLNGHTLTIFGQSIASRQAASNFLFHAYYEKGEIYPAGAWITQTLVDFNSSATKIVGNEEVDIHVDDVTIEDHATNGLQIKDEGVTLAKLEDLLEARIIIGGTADRPTAVAITGDISITKAGVVTIALDSIITNKILNKAVTLDKLQDMTLGSLLVGGAGDRPVLLAIAAGKMIIGTAAGIVAVTLSGDVTISEAGVTTIGANAITTAKILNAAVTLDKLENLSSGKIIVGNGSNRPAAVDVSGDATISNAGVVTIGNGVITASKLASAAVTPAKMSSVDEVTNKAGGVFFKTIDSATVKALLDGSVNDLCSLNIGEKVMAVFFATQTPAGIAGTVEIGPDASARGAGADTDGIMKAANANSKDFYSSLNATYRGVLQDFGWFEADGTGKLTIKSSADLSSSAWIGSITIYYLPA